MKKIPIIFFFTLALSWIGCSNEELGDYEVIGRDTFLVHSYREDYHFVEADYMVKGYVVTDTKKRTYTIPYIDGFDSIYKEGNEYVILVEESAPRVVYLDLFRHEYKLIKVIKETKVD